MKCLEQFIKWDGTMDVMYNMINTINSCILYLKVVNESEAEFSP